jgi:hypothetical protein
MSASAPRFDPERMPTFLVLGAMKAGTTALYTALDQHPDVFMSPVKEPNFFAFAGNVPDFQAPIDQRPEGVNNTSITTLNRYQELFAGATDETARGEASHWYLYHPDAPANIERYVPEARLVTMLRNPVERAYSEFLHFVRDQDEPLTDFAAALDAEEERIANHWALGRYVDRGRYDEQLERYLGRFPREQFRIYLFDDFVDDPTAIRQDLFRFIGVDPSFEPTDRRVNTSGVPQSRWLHALLTAAAPVREAVVPLLPDALVDWVNDLKNRNLEKPSMDPAVRARLIDTFRPHVHRLEDLLDRDLSHWLEQ